MTTRWQLPSADPSIALQEYEKHLLTLSSPRHRSMLETLIEHVRTVLVGDLDGVMATMVDEPEFSTWSSRGDVGPKGGATVRAGYAAAFARPGGAITNQVNKIERIVIDDDTIALELTETRIWPAAAARSSGYAIPAAEIGYFAVRRRCAVMIPFDENALIRGEMNFGFGWGVDPDSFERVPQADLSPEYTAWLKSLEGQRD